MNSREYEELNRVVQKAAKAILNTEKYFVSALAVKAYKLAQANPTDQTAIGLSGFLSKRASSGSTFITRVELREVYNKLYTPNNKFAKHFFKELGLSEVAEQNKMRRDAREGDNLVEDAYEKLADPILARELDSAFNKNASYKPFSKTSEKEAQNVCAHELNCRGVLPKKINVVAGQKDILICQAIYETPKGKCSVLIPVEIKENKALIPSMFVSKGGFVEISKKAITDHIKITAGSSFNVNVSELLNKLASAKNGVTKPMTELERIMMMASAGDETPDYAINGILKQEVDQKSANLEIPEVEQSAEVQEFAKKLASNAGIAEMVFGKNTVDKGRNLVAFGMQQVGHKNVQIAVGDSHEDSIVYAVSVANKGFNVPVKVTNGTIEEPKVALAAGHIYSFTAEGISKLLSEGETDQYAAAKASPLYDLKPSELIDRIDNSLANSKYAEAENALNILKQSGDSNAYKAGYAAYMQGLQGITKKACTETHCSAPVKTASSKYLICSHTNLPVHKVYQDEHGDCHPLYRKNQKATSDPVSFVHHKIYWE